MAKRTQEAKQPKTIFKVGDNVLYGSGPASYPWHWFHAEVLWFDGDDMMVRRYTQNGGRFNQELHSSGVRAVGTHAELEQIKRDAAEGVKEFQRKVEEAERALGAARDALWAHLGELAKGGLKVSVPDFAAMDATYAEKRAVQETLETEDAQRAAALA